MRVKDKLKVICNPISWLLLALNCSCAAKLAPGPEKGIGCASGSAIGFVDERMGEAKRLWKASTEFER
jgi:hypothetical protein